MKFLPRIKVCCRWIVTKFAIHNVSYRHRYIKSGYIVQHDLWRSLHDAPSISLTAKKSLTEMHHVDSAKSGNCTTTSNPLARIARHCHRLERWNQSVPAPLRSLLCPPDSCSLLPLLPAYPQRLVNARYLCALCLPLLTFIWMWAKILSASGNGESKSPQAQPWNFFRSWSKKDSLLSHNSKIIGSKSRG